MHRFPPIPPSELEGDQVTIHQELLAQANKSFQEKGFIYERKDGALLGPFAPLMYTALPLARHFLGVVVAMGQIPGFPASARETAIIATGVKYGCGYEVYSHQGIAEVTGALSKAQIQKILAGQCPAPDDGDAAQADGIRVAHDVTMALVDGRGPLKAELWEKAAAQFGTEGASALVHFVGYYSYVSTMLNGFDVPVPTADEGK